MRASLAALSTGGAVSRTLSASPYLPTISFVDARGCTCTRKRIARAARDGVRSPTSNSNYAPHRADEQRLEHPGQCEVRHHRRDVDRAERRNDPAKWNE